MSYVGQTSHLCERVASHVNNGKEFDHVHWVRVKQEDMMIIEAFNIAYHNPEFNVEIPDLNRLVMMLAKKVS